MATPIVFLDIAGPDAGLLRSFYSTVFGWEAATGQFGVSVATPLTATIREDPAEKRLYFGVDDVTAKLAEVQAHADRLMPRDLRSPTLLFSGCSEIRPAIPWASLRWKTTDQRCPVEFRSTATGQS